MINIITFLVVWWIKLWPVWIAMAIVAIFMFKFGMKEEIEERWIIDERR